MTEPTDHARDVPSAPGIQVSASGDVRADPATVLRAFAATPTLAGPIADELRGCADHIDRQRSRLSAIESAIRDTESALKNGGLIEARAILRDALARLDGEGGHASADEAQECPAAKDRAARY